MYFSYKLLNTNTTFNLLCYCITLVFPLHAMLYLHYFHMYFHFLFFILKPFFKLMENDVPPDDQIMHYYMTGTILLHKHF